MRPLILAAALLAPTVALAAPAPQQPPPPLVQACAQAATEQMQQAIVWHAQAITDAAEVAALKAQVAKRPKAPAPTPNRARAP